MGRDNVKPIRPTLDIRPPGGCERDTRVIDDIRLHIAHTPHISPIERFLRGMLYGSAFVLIVLACAAVVRINGG